MKRDDRIVVPDDYEQYERLQDKRAVNARFDAMEARIKELERQILDK